MTPGVVDAVAARRFVEALFASAPTGSLVELRSCRGAGMRQTFHCVEAIDEVVGEIARGATWTDVFVGVVPRVRHGGGRRDLVERANVLWVDCDTPAAVEALRAFGSTASIVVASGGGPGHVHAYWLLREPVAIDEIERANRRLAWALGADLACSEAARILRPAGSAWHKSRPPVAVRLLGSTRSPDMRWAMSSGGWRTCRSRGSSLGHGLGRARTRCWRSRRRSMWSA
jgi:hypothetical protein